MSDNWLSVTECANHVGIARTRLSSLIHKHNLVTKRVGTKTLVDLASVQQLLSKEAAEGRIRGPRKTKENEIDDRQRIRELERELDVLRSENYKLRLETSEVKLLTERAQSLEIALSQAQAQLQAENEERLKRYDKARGTIIGRMLGL